MVGAGQRRDPGARRARRLRRGQRGAGTLTALPRIPARDPGRGVVSGVCAGLARELDTDPTVVRLLFGVLALAGGAGVVVYLAATLLMPAPEGARPGRARSLVGVLVLLASALAVMSGLALPWYVQVAVVLAVAAGLLGWRGEHRVAAALLGLVAITVLLTGGSGVGGGPVLTPAAFAGALALIVVPWAWRTMQERQAERTRRIRSDERAEMAARVHDSVLQTLALIQREPADARRVEQLARRQERELRAWLYPGNRLFDEETLAGAVTKAAAEIEELHGVRVDVVTSGNRPLEDDVRALALAAREAMVNAAKFSGVEEISVYVEAGPEGTSVFVRDRGVGFDRPAVASGRSGLVESIEGRMARHGGTATIASAPGEGTEVELSLPGRPS